MELHVSLVGRKDLSGEIYRQLRQAILKGRLRPGDALPPSRELAQRLSVSRTTVTVAYERLWGEGFVTSRVGAGTFVNPQVSLVRDGAALQQTANALRPRAIWKLVPLPPVLVRPAQFDFRLGLPDASLFPYGRWRRLTARSLHAEAVGKAMYAHPGGQRALREAIARHIGISRAVQTAPDDVVITSGTQQALDVVARALLAPGDRVAMEDPGYTPARLLFESLGLRVKGVPVDRDGLVVDKLPRNARLVYVTPSHQFPLGMSMGLSRRLALLMWAEKHNAAIIEDDYDSEFRYEGRPIEPLQTLDRTGRVIYIGSFSKTLLPTLRLGFLVTPASVRNAVLSAKYVTDWHTPVPAQEALAAFINDGGFARHIRRARATYRTRHDLITSILARDFRKHLDVIPSAAGLHVTALARTGTHERLRSVVRRAADAGVAVPPLAPYAVDLSVRPGLALGYGAIRTDQIEEGLRRLRACFTK